MIKTLDDVREYRKLVPVGVDVDGNPSNLSTSTWASENQDSLGFYQIDTFLGDVYELLRNTKSLEEKVEIWHFWLDASDLEDDDQLELEKKMGYDISWSTIERNQ